MRWLISGAATLLLSSALEAQVINFTTELPRTLVVLRESGAAVSATREVSAFLRAAGFPIVDRALVGDVADERVRAALNGERNAVLEVGRNAGAHVLVAGTVEWDSTFSNQNRRTQSRTAEIELSAWRLDDGRLVAQARGRGSAVDADVRIAGARAVRHAIDQIVQHSDFAGALANNWEEVQWSHRDYFGPDPGSPTAAAQQYVSEGAPGLAIVNTEVVVPTSVARPGPLRIGTGPAKDRNVRLEGIVVGRVSNVLVAGQKAELTALNMREARRLGLEPTAQRFRATVPLTPEQNMVTVRATAPGGEMATARASANFGKRWAVIVGTGSNKRAEPGEPGQAARDARAVYDLLRSSEIGPFDPENLLLLTDEQATTEAIREALFMFLQQAQPQDLVVFYFAGQSVADPLRPDNLYLLAHDSDMRALASSALPMWDLKTALRRRIRAERVIVLADVRHRTDATEIQRAFADLFTPSNRLALTTVSGNQDVMVRRDGHGIFTYNLIEGLKGLADADRNGIVTFNEAADYVTGMVKLQTSGRESPVRTGLGDVPLAEVRAVRNHRSNDPR